MNTLGKDLSTQELVCLPDSARESSLYIIGVPGVGKSALMQNIALQDMDNGHGLCFLDPAGDSVERLLLSIPPKRIADTIIWDPKDIAFPFNLNPFYCPTPDDPIAVDRKVENFISALSSLQEFSDIFRSAPQMLDTLRHLAFACVLKQGTTLLDTIRFLTKGDYRRAFYPALRRYNRPDILDYWETFDEKTPKRKDELTSSSLNKLHRLATTSITRSIFQEYRPNIDFRSLMDQGKILLVNLSQLGEGNGELIGAFIVFELLQAGFSRGNIPEQNRRPFYLFADEFERFMSTAFPRIIDEGRKFKLYCVLAHQHRGQLSGQSLGSTLTIKNQVVFRVNSKDAEELSWGFRNDPKPVEVIGKRPILSLSHEPWDELFRSGHTNPEIVERVIRLGGLIEQKECYTVTDFSLTKQLNRGAPFEVKRLFYRVDLSRGIDVQTLRRQETFTIKNCAVWGNSYFLARQQGKQDKTSLVELVELWRRKTWIWEVMEVEFPKHRLLPDAVRNFIDELFIRTIVELGDLLSLEENHIKTESGQYEPVYGSQRPRADVSAEIANRLTNLPKFIARVKIDLHEPVEYVVRTFDVPEPPTDAQATVDRIRDYSRRRYGRPLRRLSVEPDSTEHGILAGDSPAHDGTNSSLSEARPQSLPQDSDDDFWK